MSSCPPAPAAAEWQAAANHMIDYYVETVYVAPGAGDPAMLATLAAAGDQPDRQRRSHRSHPGRTGCFRSAQTHWRRCRQLLPQILAGQGGQNLPLPLEFTQINPALLSPGKQALAEQVLADLLAGYIDTGVDLVTGENQD